MRPTIDAAVAASAAGPPPPAPSASTPTRGARSTTSSHEALRKSNAPCGAKPIECRTPSRPSTCSRDLVGQRVEVLRVGRRRARPPAPASAAAWRCLRDAHRAAEGGEHHLGALLLREPGDVEGDRGVGEDAGDEQPLAVEESHVRSSFRVRESVASVTHAEAAVDRDDRAADVARRRGRRGTRTVSATSSHRAEPLAGDRREVRLLRVLGQRGRHVGVDEAGRDDVRP